MIKLILLSVFGAAVFTTVAAQSKVKRCGRNEIYDSCPPSCSSQSCQNITLPCSVEPGVCRPACLCKKGYFRNNDDICVTRKECETCTGPYEKYDKCAPQCSPQSCSSLVGPRPQCLPIAPGQCFGACRCIEGYYRNDEGFCIRKEKCELCTRQNEIYDECPPNCSPDTCASLYEDNSDCVAPAVCRPACRCTKGTSRNEDGDCIPVNDCPCKIGQRFKSDDGCNTCTCGNNGRRSGSACTLRACVPSDPTPTAGLD